MRALPERHLPGSPFSILVPAAAAAAPCAATDPSARSVDDNPGGDVDPATELAACRAAAGDTSPPSLTEPVLSLESPRRSATTTAAAVAAAGSCPRAAVPVTAAAASASAAFGVGVEDQLAAWGRRAREAYGFDGDLTGWADADEADDGGPAMAAERKGLQHNGLAAHEAAYVRDNPEVRQIHTASIAPLALSLLPPSPPLL